MSMPIILRRLGLMDYQRSYEAMSLFTTQRGIQTSDEIWCLQHPSVYTLGLAGKQEHILDAGEIPVIKTDRGGQVTYHGPGQLLIYLLVDLRRRKIGIKDYVRLLEQSLIDYLLELGLSAQRRPGAPGVYIEDRKIAALGIRVRRACSYHGLALNVNMDTSPFSGINPCGYPNLQVTQLADFGLTAGLDEVIDGLLKVLLRNIAGEPYNIVIKQGLADLLSDHATA
ncbi:MAG: lipoyl(octanoyl) transferase [Planctomycetota bacterium]|jgi:lipoyl(octanoyl) transferase